MDHWIFSPSQSELLVPVSSYDNISFSSPPPSFSSSPFCEWQFPYFCWIQDPCNTSGASSHPKNIMGRGLGCSHTETLEVVPIPNMPCPLGPGRSYLPAQLATAQAQSSKLKSGREGLCMLPQALLLMLLLHHCDCSLPILPGLLSLSHSRYLSLVPFCCLPFLVNPDMMVMSFCHLTAPLSLNIFWLHPWKGHHAELVWWSLYVLGFSKLGQLTWPNTILFCRWNPLLFPASWLWSICLWNSPFPFLCSWRRKPFPSFLCLNSMLIVWELKMPFCLLDYFIVVNLFLSLE